MKRLIVAAVVALTTFAAGCSSQQRIAFEKGLAEATISDEQEFQLGFQVHEELKKQNVKFLDKPEVGLYVEKLANKLMPSANKDRKLTWQWFVIDDSKTVNAFATPGGRVYVYTGLLKAARSEAEVIGVLGHEMGHVVARHSARQLIGQYGLQTVVSMALGKDAGDVAKVAAALGGQVGMMAYGRSMELESDELGARYANTAGYDPNGLVQFFEKLKELSGSTPEALVWLSTHPSNDERIQKLTEQIAREQLNAKERGEAELKAIQAMIP